MPDTTTAQPADVLWPEHVELTREGFEELKRQLVTLQTVTRPGLLRQAQRAALFLEPSMADSLASVARHDLERVDQQIADLEERLRRAQVAHPQPGSEVAEVGTLVTVRYADGAEETLALVGPTEAITLGTLVASTSALGRALLGKRPGDRVTVDGLDGEKITVQIVSVKAADSDTDTAEG